MRAIVPATIVLCFSNMSFAGQGNDQMMPDVVKKAKTTVEVCIKYKVSTGACFPDQSARVRMVSDKILLTDLALYTNMSANLSEGLVAFKKQQAWGACDKNGKIVIAPQFESEFSFCSGLAAVEQDGKYGFIDKSASWVIKPVFDANVYIGAFVGNACPVRIGEKNAVINKKGEYLWGPGLFIAEVQGGGILIHARGGQLGFLDDSGALIPEGKPNPRFHKEGEPTLFGSLQVDALVLQQLKDAGL